MKKQANGKPNMKNDQNQTAEDFSGLMEKTNLSVHEATRCLELCGRNKRATQNGHMVRPGTFFSVRSLRSVRFGPRQVVVATLSCCPEGGSTLAMIPAECITDNQNHGY